MSGNYIKTVTGVIIPYEGKFVLVKTKKDGKYGLPGGKVDPFEEIETAGPREVEEETGLTVILKDFIGVYQHKSDRGSSIANFIYSSEIIEGDMRIMEKDKIEDIGIFSLSEVRNLYRGGNLRSGLANLRPIEHYLKGITFNGAVNSLLH